MEETVAGQVGTLLHQLASVDLSELDDASLDAELVALAQARQRLDAELARRAAVWHRRGVWSSDGSRSAAARLARDGAMSKRSASTLIGHGTAVTEMPMREERITLDVATTFRMNSPHPILMPKSGAPSMTLPVTVVSASIEMPMPKPGGSPR